MPDYTAYELTLRVPFPCPALPHAPAGALPDVVVVDGSVPQRLAAPVVAEAQWDAEPDRFLWRGGSRAGRFLVEGGRWVTLERNAAAEDEMLAFHFLHMVLAAVLRQRGMLVLHANTAVTPTGAVAIAGESGAGKSTTLAALLARGCTMLADDITALKLTPDGGILALPGTPQLHLCEDAAEELGQDVTGLPRFPWRRWKAAVPTTTSMASSPAPLRSLYELSACPCDDLRIYPRRGVEKFATLQSCVYGPLLPEEHAGQFDLFAAAAEQVTVFAVNRPVGRWSVDELVEIMLHG